MVAKFAQSVGLAVVLAALTVAQSAPGRTTRYWDCCKPSCAWSGKADVLQPVQTCDSGGNKLTDPNAASSCGGGQAFTCVDNQPWAVDDNLAYGFAAVHLTGSNEAQWCCQCYELTFTSGPAAGKRLVVQATNTGGDLGENHFDLLIPGGGVGLFNGCPAQFGSWNGGQQYGGVGSRAECDQLPESVRAGCYFRFDWFMNSDNPPMDFKQVACPAELTQKSGCMRSDANGPAPEPTPAPAPVPEPVPAPEPQPGNGETVTIIQTVTDTVTETQTVTETVTSAPAPTQTTAEPPVDDGDDEVPCNEEPEIPGGSDGEDVDPECPTKETN